jgi:hypothetical protein
VVLWGIAFLIPVPGVQVSPEVLFWLGFSALRLLRFRGVCRFCSPSEILEHSHSCLQRGWEEMSGALGHPRIFMPNGKELYPVTIVTNDADRSCGSPRQPHARHS